MYALAFDLVVADTAPKVSPKIGATLALKLQKQVTILFKTPIEKIRHTLYMPDYHTNTGLFKLF
ncbi:hypothetical protein ACSLVK_18860 [Photorhabdus tasmaniensis]|uniref:hypothetical protein n=1 Tax=Photorhabdus tasmaniensis TaxID=1004159 RepID=UPI0040428467